MSLKDAFAGMKEVKAQPTQIDLEEHLSLTPANGKKPRAGRAIGKSADPDFERLTVYVRKETKKAVTRKWEDATDGKEDLSDLTELLLTKYLNT
jgi:hypothetical protein